MQELYRHSHNSDIGKSCALCNQIEAIKERVAALDYAARVCESGLCHIQEEDGFEWWEGRCPIRPHNTSIRPFYVDEKMWECSACEAGGDVIALAQALARCDDEDAATLLYSIYVRKGGLRW
jgi:hypothetical protein